MSRGHARGHNHSVDETLAMLWGMAHPDRREPLDTAAQHIVYSDGTNAHTVV